MDTIHDNASFLTYCRQHFGRLNKKDYEIIVFHLLMLRKDLKGKSDFEISRQLRITESKVKQFRYEESLLFQLKDDDYQQRMVDLLKNASFKFTDGKSKIQFCITDKMLRHYLHDKLNEIGSFADSSFNSNIVTVTPKDLLFLFGTKANHKDIQQINKSLCANSKELPKDLHQRLKSFSKAAIKDAIGKFAPELAEWVTNWIDELEIKQKNS